MAIQYENIAVAIDFSQQSLVALERAIEIAKQHEATLHLISIVDTQSFGAIGAYDLRYADQVKAERVEQIEQLKTKVIEAGVSRIETVVEAGSPKEILTSYEANLIVIGATGLSRVEKMVLGSVSEKVVRHAKCDVLIVRNNA